MMGRMDGQRGSRSLVPRRATPADAAVVATLLHEFNTEFGEPSPGPEVLAARLRRLLATDGTIALLAGEPAVGVALLTLRSNVWSDAPVTLLDELYVAPSVRSLGIGSALLAAGLAAGRSRGVELMEVNVDGEDLGARRFYERHGFSCVHSEGHDPALYYSRALSP
jgi:GNAT superfamily N-acetyltransferase